MMLDYPAKISALVPQVSRAVLRELKRIPLRAINLALSRHYQFSSHCPCCNHKTIYWLDYDNHYRASICPHCSSHPRHRLIQLYLQKETDLFFKPQKLLHVAPEKIFQRKFKKMQHLDYITIDINARGVDYAYNVCALPFASNSFDIVLCNHVLEHVENDKEAIKEIYRVLKPGGWAMLNVPIDTTRSQTFEDSSIISPKDRKHFYWQEDHRRLYGLDYKSKLESAGFQVEVKEFARLQSEFDRQIYNLNIYEDLYIGKKAETI